MDLRCCETSDLTPDFWPDQPADQLLDSLGKPDDIDQKVLKTKKKRFGSTITKEVIGTGSE